MEERLYESVAQPRFRTILLSLFASAALGIAAVGHCLNRGIDTRDLVERRTARVSAFPIVSVADRAVLREETFALSQVRLKPDTTVGCRV